MRTAVLCVLGMLLADFVSADVRAVVRLRLDPLSRTPTLYLLSFPHGGALRDVANGANRFPDNPCDVSGSGPDGVVDSDDVLCSLWGAGDPAGRVGRMTVSQRDPATCSWLSRTASHGPLGIVFAGAPFAVDPDAGWLVELGATAGDPPHDAAVTLEGPCVPAFLGVTLEGASCALVDAVAILHVPYLTTLRSTLEIACGVEGLDWVDADGDALPDTCPGGLYDGVHAIAVDTWVNDTEHGPLPAEQRTGWIGTGLRPGPGGTVVYVDPHRVDVAPGQAFRLRFESGFAGTWDPPVEPCPLARQVERLPLP